MSDDELLDVFDAAGRLVGTKSRAQVHRDRDWHRIVFVWSARRAEDGRRRMLMQLRGRENEPFAGQIDALAAGHVARGEEPLDAAIRECREEAGIELREDELALLGTRAVENFATGCPRSLQSHFLVMAGIELRATRPSAEVDRMVEVDLEDFARFMRREIPHITAGYLDPASGAIRELVIGSEATARYSEQIMDNFRIVTAAIERALATGRVVGERFPRAPAHVDVRPGARHRGVGRPGQ